MFIHLKRLGNQILFYGLGDTINRIISVLILPIFTHYLSPADYGVASLLTVTNAFIVALADLGLVSSIIRFYREKNADQKKIVATAQIAMVFSTLIVAVLALPFRGQISQFFFKTPDYGYIVALNFLTIPMVKILTAPLIRFRIEEKAKTCAFINVSQVALMMGLNLFLIVGLKRGINGLFEGPFLSAAVFALIFMIYSLKTHGLNYSHSLFKRMFLFGSPLILNAVSMWIINWADRFILSKMADLTQVGLYTLGYSIGMAISLLVGSFIAAWPPFYMSIANEPNAKKIYASIFTFYSFAIGFFVLLIAVFGRDYFQFFTSEKFHGASLVVPLVALSYALRGNFSIIAAGAYLKKKTYLVTASELISMVINIVLVYILVRYMGRIGAAWATLVSFAFLPLLMYIFTKKIFPVKYDWGRLFQVLIIGTGLYFFTKAIYEPTWPNLLYRGLIVIIYPLPFLAIGFFKAEEINRVKSLLRRKPKNAIDSPTG